MNLSTNIQTGDPDHAALHNAERTSINDSFKTQRTDNYLLVKSADDLPAASGGEHLLPADSLVEIAGAVDISPNALRLNDNTLLRGMGGDQLISSADGVVRCSGLNGAVVMREFSIIATGGRCFDLSGSIDHQLNLFFMGLIGAAPGTSAGTINGFDVQAVKDCYINAPDGVTFSGITNKTFVSQSPFYGITGSAIRLAADYDAKIFDIPNSFFKFDSPGVAFEAVVGYQLGMLRSNTNIIDGTAIPLVGIDPADPGTLFYGNTGIRDSRTAAQAYLTTPATMPIAAIDTYYPVAGAFAVSDIAERFELNIDNELVYTGLEPALIEFTSSFAIDIDSNNDRLAFRVAKNGTTWIETTSFVEQGQGAGAGPRHGTCVGLVDVVTGDRLGLYVANLETTTSIDWLSATYRVRG